MAVGGRRTLEPVTRVAPSCVQVSASTPDSWASPPTVSGLEQVEGQRWWGSGGGSATTLLPTVPRPDARAAGRDELDFVQGRSRAGIPDKEAVHAA